MSNAHTPTQSDIDHAIAIAAVLACNNLAREYYGSILRSASGEITQTDEDIRAMYRSEAKAAVHYLACVRETVETFPSTSDLDDGRMVEVIDAFKRLGLNEGVLTADTALAFSGDVVLAARVTRQSRDRVLIVAFNQGQNIEEFAGTDIIGYAYSPLPLMDAALAKAREV